MTRSRGIGGHIDEFDHAADLRTPKAFNARSITSFGLRSPLAVTLTIAFAIRSVIGSFALVTPTSTNAASYAAFMTSISSGPKAPLAINLWMATADPPHESR